MNGFDDITGANGYLWNMFALSGMPGYLMLLNRLDEGEENETEF